MKISGFYGFESDVWICKLELLDIREIAKTKEELFLKLNNQILDILKLVSKEKATDDDFSIEIFDDNNFSVKFFEPRYVTALLFKKLRKNERLTQSRVALELGSGQNSYAQYEEGKREPSLGKFTDILNVLGYEWQLTLQKK
ncbi:helix-turn-helix domain-containing protein [Fluviispira vulneris]|uniref:helix-turn-helix domain-containing protein n=1 Tax=Fluviispira vulneris TaxID=2763012 RepID=UPI0016464621|nr:helix-turn-helix transcriptional regulator [Fluviispira vulneris]